MMDGSQPDWLSANCASWDERVPLHLKAHSYDLRPLRAGRGNLQPIEEGEIGSVDGLRVLHLQCHFGRDTLTLAQRGAKVVGVDFSGEAITVARRLATELGLDHRARFVHADIYATPDVLLEPAAFDRVFVSWGAINWLPDIVGWAKVVAHFLKPGGALYLAEHHPAIFVFDDETKTPDGMPGWFWPYFSREACITQAPTDYTEGAPRLRNGPIYEWIHPLGAIVTALCQNGLSLKWLHEHDALPWPAFSCLQLGKDGLWRWPDQPWLPMSFSLWAERT
jgi:SAM-dependent methyltransferase